MSNQTFEVQVRVKGGFPVVVRGEIYPAERDVGLMTRYIGDYTVFTLKGQWASWLNLTLEQENRMIEDVWTEINKESDDGRANSFD